MIAVFGKRGPDGRFLPGETFEFKHPGEENGTWRAIKPQTFDPVIKKRLSEVLLRGEELRRDNDMDLQLSARAFPVVRCDPKLLNEAESAPEVPPPKALLRTACRNLLSESCTASGNAKRE